MRNVFCVGFGFCFVAVGCGGSNSSNGGGGGNGGGAGGGLAPLSTQAPSSGEATPAVYEDLKEPSGQRVPVGQWPSQLDGQKLIPACLEPAIAYLDECWDSVVIDADTMRVQFVKGVATAEIAIGEPLPAKLGAVLLPKEQWRGDNSACYSQHPKDSKYWDSRYDSCSLEHSLWGMFGMGFDNRPWATSYRYWTYRVQEKETLAGFGVRALFAYGMVVGSDGFKRIAHNWNYKGNLKINGKVLPLPLKFSDVVAASGTNEKNLGGYRRSLVFKNTLGGSVKFVASSWLASAKALQEQYRGNYEGYSLEYVSDVWFYSSDAGQIDE